MQCLIPAVMALYVLSITESLKRKNWIWLALLLLPALANAAVLVANPWQKAIFGMREGRYVYGPLFPGLYLVSAFYVGVVIVAVNRRRARIPFSHYLTIMLFAIVVALAVVIQYFYPRYLLTGVAIAVAMTMMYLVMHKPEHMLDMLTGVFNREALLLFLHDRITERKPYQLMLVEVNNIRSSNTLLGYAVGNEVLRSSAQFLAEHSDGWVFRMISNQFVVVTSGETRFQALITAIRARMPLPWDIQGASIILSASVACFPDTSGITRPEDALRVFEATLPKLARGEVRVLDEDAIHEIQRMDQVESALNYAIEHETFEVYFQPIYSLERKRFVAAEALVRLTDSKLGALRPDEFIPIAEKNNLVLNIDEQVMRMVCAFIRRCDPARTLGLERIEINLSAAEFTQERLTAKIKDVIAEYQVPHDYLLFEITETAATLDHRLFMRTMRALTDEGFSFALDDYGSGYANISQVAQLPFKMIKLDRSMLVAHDETRVNAILFEHTVAMLRSMGFTTLVKGVETKEHLELLRRAGAELAQGYLFARPMPIAAFVEFLKKASADVETDAFT